MKKHAKILATLGPASEKTEIMNALITAGANAFRLNFSHGTHQDHAARIQTVRQLAAENKVVLTLLQDLQGPKIRVGLMKEPTLLTIGDTLVLDSNPEEGTARRVHLPHPEILETLHVGDAVYINDGIIRLEVTEKQAGTLTTKVRAGGTLSSRKGVNVPGRALPFTALTDKDKEDLAFGLAQGVDWVALSFVQRAQDIEDAKALIQGKASIMAKIETTAAIEDLEAIIAAADGIMIARGDLGVELPTEEVPPIQKKIIRLCRDAGKPVVVATQMLESMIHQPIPTRAEASDVANATYEGADCLMLSAESASGDYPVEAVSTMAKIITRVERSSAWEDLLGARAAISQGTVADAVSAAACQTAKIVGAKAIVVFTESGSSALRIGRHRPLMPMVALTPYAGIARRMALQWGVLPIQVEGPQDTDSMVQLAQKTMLSHGLAEEKDIVVIAAGVPFGQKGSTNLLRVLTL
ncbi:MAG: pyruvate kinase [Alphaproteobacteria bacterium CG_4_10_14_0_8_um_filter_53_9]|nr:MAG: pyruvate kinase [Alphaproteobacteria bacterium CG_4_10_14_0_8_um_filter_53_9]